MSLIIAVRRSSPTMTEVVTTHDGREPGETPGHGPFDWWWQVLGSNQRRLSRRFTARSWIVEEGPVMSSAAAVATSKGSRGATNGQSNGRVGRRSENHGR